MQHDSREKRFELANQLHRVAFVELDSPSIWLRDASPLSLTTVDAQGLQHKFYDADGYPRVELLRWKEHHTGVGGAEFFKRNARLLEQQQKKKKKRAGVEEAFDESRLDKYHKANLKHGSDLSRLWRVTKELASRFEPIAAHMAPIAPKALKQKLKVASNKAMKRLMSLEYRADAFFEGVPTDNPGFHLWWHTRKKLWAKPSEVGGLAEIVDLHELRLWPLCALITLDKRMHTAVGEALKEIEWDGIPIISDRFVRAGSERRIVDRLDARPTAAAVY